MIKLFYYTDSPEGFKVIPHEAYDIDEVSSLYNSLNASGWTVYGIEFTNEDVYNQEAIDIRTL